ncbi:beta-hydroxyacyl-ACP dehydratase [Micromonospora sp. R77]|uniref:3-hydroxyacyl-ACP dehydratase FabZ family protein n=1 Tax=Micromonospora sp. R77 TaxID=2925836 RepID=UPI001F61BBA2|nr:beta-hydroxyacyl-ACP dehydratase [Micromonospora sp. R77]MCI4066462.1 beta-hydroxyacyl-ACP dehydratase [Micromonospora sp. R77]
MNIAQIRAVLPQRHPLLLVDRVLSRGDDRIETIKAITATEPCYARLGDDATVEDHAYPVSLLIESFGQSAALLWLHDAVAGAGHVLLFVGARDYTVEGHAYPGDTVRHVVHLERVVADTAFATGESWVGDRRIAVIGSLMAARRPADTLAVPA